MAGGYDGSIRIDSSIDSKGFNTGIKGMMGAVAKLGAALGIALGIGALINFGRQAVSTASSVAEQVSKFKTVFKEYAGGAEQALADFADQTNRSKNEMYGFAATMQDTFVPLGFARDQAAGLSVEVVKLATDLSSFNDVPTGDALRDIQSALVGNYETVRKYGVVLSQTTVEERARAMGLWDGVGAMTAQARAAVALQLITEGNTDAQGDATRTAGSFANQMRGISSAMLDLKVAVGTSVMPIIMAIVPYIRAAISQLIVFFNMVAGIVAALFGVQLSTAAQAMEEMAGGTEAAADAQGDLAEQTTAAGKAAKGALAPFDELNVLQQQEATGGGGGGGVGGGTGITPPVVGETGSALDEVTAKVETLKNTLLAFFAPLQAPFERLKEAALTLGGTIWTGLIWVWENILKPLGVWLIQTVAPIFLDIFAGALEVLNSVLEALKPLGLWLWENFLQPIAEWTGGVIVDVLQWISDKLTLLSDWIDNHKEAVQTFIIIIGSFAAAWWLVNTAVTAWTAISLIATGVTAGFGAAVAFLTSPIFLVVLAIGAIIAIIILLIKNWDWVKETAGKVWDWIVDKWQDAGKWFTDNVTEPIRLAFKTALDWVKDTWETVWGGVKDFTKNTINTIIDFINSMIRAVAGGINAVIGALNRLQVTIPSWVPEIGGQTWGLNIPLVEAPQIPRLAKGAVIPPNAEFLAMLGDQRSGRNIEAPEALLRQIVQEEVGRVQADIRIEFGGTLGALVRELKPHIDRETVRIGRSLVSGGAA